MKICIQVWYNGDYWVHHLERVNGNLFWIHAMGDPDNQSTPFPDYPILKIPRGRSFGSTVFPYLEGDLEWIY